MRRLPRLQRGIEIVEPDRSPTRKHQMEWQSVVEAIEGKLGATGAPEASTATATHKVPVTIGETTYYLLLSDT